MKKTWSIILVLVLTFYGVPINSIAHKNDNASVINIEDYADSRLDLTQYTIEDIANMSVEEYLAFILEFERIYNPYNSYIATRNEINEFSVSSHSTAYKFIIFAARQRRNWDAIICRTFL